MSRRLEMNLKFEEDDQIEIKGQELYKWKQA